MVVMAAAADVGSSDEAVQATNDDATICKRYFKGSYHCP